MNACKDKNCFTYYRHKDPTPWTCPKCQTIWRVNNAEWEKVATKKDEPANMTSTLERATKFLDYRLTGSEGVIAISIMAEFADTLIAERDAAYFNQELEAKFASAMLHGELNSKAIDELTGGDVVKIYRWFERNVGGKQ